MAGNIPMGSMSTEIKLNGSQPVKTLKELKQAVAQATSAWKAQRAELSTIGKSTEAAEAKYKGLAETIKKQKDYISGLQEAQKHLQEAQKSVDRSTKEGQQEYGKYNEALQKNETRIHSAEQKLASLTNQQTKAKSSLNYYKSGLADVQKQLKTNESVAQSYVVRLEAEGKGYESAKAKLNSYKDSLTNLRKQQSIQTSELSRIARETGKSSDAYKRQEVRVNQTATSIAKLNSKIKSSQTEVNKLNPHGFNKLANGAQHVTNVADKMKSGLKHAWDNVKTGATAAAAGIGAVGAAAISGAKKAGNLQQVYKEITNLAVTGGEKQREAIKNVTAMQRQGRDMSIKYGKSQQDIAEAFEDLVKRGYTTKQALGAMRAELQGSVASGDDFKDVVSVSSTVLESFGMRAKTVAQMTSNTKRAVNELAYAADMTSTGFEDLGYGMSYVGSSAHQAGFNLSETASAMGILSNNGLEASKAGTGLNQVINRLSDATGKLVKGDKKNALAKLGIKPKEITDSTGKLKSLATVFGVLNKHMKGMTKVQKINIMKSLFGMTGEQAGLILAKYNKQLGSLSKNVLKAGKNGKYVADLSAKNSQTAKMQMARLKQAGDAFTMTLGAKMLPAINEAGDSLVVFLTKSKDGKRLTNDFAKAVEGLATGLANTIKWIAHHRTETKLIAEGLGATYGVVKLASFVQWLNKTRLAFKGLSIGSKLLSGWDKSLIHLSNAKTRIGKVASAIGKLNGKFLSVGKKLGTALGNGLKSIGDKALSAGKFLGSKIAQGIKATMKFSMGKRLATGALAGAAVATPEVVNAIKDRHSANKRSQDIGGAVGALAGGTLTSMIPVVGPLLAPVGAIIGKYAGQWGGKAVNNFTKGWQRNKPPKKFWSLENLGYSAHNMWKGFQKGVSNTIQWFKKNWKEVGLYFISPLAGAINSLYKHNSKFRKWVNGLAKGFQNAWKGVAKWWDNTWKNINSNRYVKAFKKGQFFSTALKNMRSRFSAFNKWFGNKWSSTWRRVNSNRYVQAFTKGRFFSTALKDMKSRWSSFNKWLGKNWNSFWKSTRKLAKKSWDGTVKNWNSMWKSINSGWESFETGLGKGWRSFWNELADFFGDIWKSMKKTASGGINGIVGAINGGISGIDNVIHSFGGKSHAISLIPKVKLATGTLGNLTPSITRPTLALLNDGHDSPETGNKETIWDTKTGALGVVNGTNVPFILQPGMEVFSASQSRDLGFTHFANGTNPLAGIGKFFGGIGSWIGQKTNQLKKWFELATKIVSHPIQALSSLMHPSSKGLNGIFVQLGKGMFDKSKDAATSWWSALWNMASSKLNGDGGPATGLLKAVEKYGEDHNYVWGAAGPSSFDCSGLVMYALKHAYGIDFPHFSGSQYDMTQHISRDQARMGDLVFWGNHGDEHVGVYAGGNRYFSAESPSQGIHMNTLDSVVGKGKPLFGRVRGLSQSSKKEAVKATNSLQRLIKGQVGNGFFKFLAKLGDLFGMTGEAGMPTGDHSHWLKQAHVPKSWWNDIAWIIDRESGWRATAKNPTSTAYGIGQLEDYTPYRRHGHDWRTNPITQLMGMVDYIRGRYGNATNARAFWESHNWYANGGIASTPSIFGEAGPEMAIPLIPSKSTRAWELIGKAVAVLSGQSGLNQQQAQIDVKKEKEEHNFRQAVLLLLQQLVAKNGNVDVKLTTPAGRALWEVVEPYSKQEQRAEQIRERRGLSGRFG